MVHLSIAATCSMFVFKSFLNCSDQAQVLVCRKILTRLFWLPVFCVSVCRDPISIVFAPRSVHCQRFLSWGAATSGCGYAICGVTRCFLRPKKLSKESRMLLAQADVSAVSNWKGTHLCIDELVYCTHTSAGRRSYSSCSCVRRRKAVCARLSSCCIFDLSQVYPLSSRSQRRIPLRRDR